MAQPRSALRLLVGLGQPALPLAARDRGDGVDRRVVLLHRARQPPRAAEGSRRREARRRRRGVGGARRRLLPRREVPRRAGAAARAAALVQVGGVHDVALGLRAVHRRLLLARVVVPDRSDASPTCARGRRSRSRSAGIVLAWLVYDGLCRAFANDEGALAVLVFAFICLSAWGSWELFAPRAAFLQVGAMIGTMMVGNVFFVIIPAHWKLVRAKEAGERARPALEPRRQDAVGAQQLPDAAGRARDALEPLPVHLRAPERLARARRADGDRRADAPLLQPAPPRPERLADPRRRRRRARRRRA